jgi:hypothetical protein
MSDDPVDAAFKENLRGCLPYVVGAVLIVAVILWLVFQPA